MAGCKVVAYADDAALLVSSPSIRQLRRQIESCIGKVQKWYTENGLLINSDKTEFMILKQRGTHEVNVRSGDKLITIKSKNCLKVLGMKIDSQLTWSNHIAQIKSRTTNAIRNIARTNNVLSLKSRLTLTNALVVPHYNYGDIIYDGCTAKVREDLERNQNYAARAMLGRPKYSSAMKALQELEWLPLHRRRQIHQCVFVHKALKGHSSYHATNAIADIIPNHSHSTRQKQANTLYSWQHRTTLSEKSVLYASTHAWSSCPKAVRAIKDTKNFKNQLQNFLIDNFKDSCVGESS